MYLYEISNESVAMRLADLLVAGGHWFTFFKSRFSREYSFLCDEDELVREACDSIGYEFDHVVSVTY